LREEGLCVLVGRSLEDGAYYFNFINEPRRDAAGIAPSGKFDKKKKKGKPKIRRLNSNLRRVSRIDATHLSSAFRKVARIGCDLKLEEAVRM
jgi:hypothetical protein